MKFLLFGYGSMGRRHEACLRPPLYLPEQEHSLIVADTALDDKPARPTLAWTHGLAMYQDWRRALAEHPDADGAVIASPTAAHADQALALAEAGISFLLEKPASRPEDLAGLERASYIAARRGLSCAVGFQYRFHPEAGRFWGLGNDLTLIAQDDLLGRYGAQVEEMIFCHALANALYILGPKRPDRANKLVSNGLMLEGQIAHAFGVSRYACAIDRGPRISKINDLDLYPDDGMYRRQDAAWLRWLAGGERDPRLATLADGLAVSAVMGEIDKE